MSRSWLSRQPWCGFLKQTNAPTPTIVYIEGNIGVGKSTLLETLQEKGYPVVQEPVSLWTNFHGINFLELYSQDMQKWAFTFQSMVLSTLWQAQLEAVQSKAPIVVAERSLHSVVKMFAKAQTAEGFMCPEQFVLLESMSKAMASQFNRKEHHIYLRGSATLAYQRLKSRARMEETSLSQEYLQTLHRILDDWMEAEPALHAVVDATGTPEAVQQQVLQVLGQLHES